MLAVVKPEVKFVKLIPMTVTLTLLAAVYTIVFVAGTADAITFLNVVAIFYPNVNAHCAEVSVAWLTVIPADAPATPDQLVPV